MQLFGFASADERQLFEQLLGVTGVGPKVRSGSCRPTRPASSDGRSLPRTPRSSRRSQDRRKLAQRIVIELGRRSRVARVSSRPPVAGAGDGHLMARDASGGARLLRRRGRAAPCGRRSRPAPAERVRAASEGCVSDDHRARDRAVASRRTRTSPTGRSGRAASTSSSDRSVIKEQLAIELEAAKGAGEALDHVLLAGPPGSRQDEPRPHHPRGDGRRHPDRRRARRSSGRATWPRS